MAAQSRARARSGAVTIPTGATVLEVGSGRIARGTFYYGSSSVSFEL